MPDHAKESMESKSIKSNHDDPNDPNELNPPVSPEYHKSTEYLEQKRLVESLDMTNVERVFMHQADWTAKNRTKAARLRREKAILRLLEPTETAMERESTHSDLKYSIRILDNGDDTFSVEVPKLPGCYSAGKTKDECIANVVEAIELHLEGLEKAPAQDPIPGIEVV